MALILFLALPFYGFWLGSAYGKAKQYERDALAESQKTFAAPSLTATKVVDYVPPAPAENATIVVGSCWTNSIAAPYRSDAWRCTVGNEIHDPCFQIPGNANLLCDPNPGNIADASPVILSLVKPLPKSGKPFAAGHAPRRRLAHQTEDRHFVFALYRHLALLRQRRHRILRMFGQTTDLRHQHR